MKAIAPADAASQRLLREQITSVLCSLTKRERKVLQLRYGLEDGRAAPSKRWAASSASLASAYARSRRKPCASCATLPRSRS